MPVDTAPTPAAGPVPARTAYRDALVDLMGRRVDQLCLDTDTGLFSGVDFGDAAEHYLNIGIAEHTLMGMAAGLADSGWYPWVHTMAAFAGSRAAEAVKLDISYPGLPVRIVGTHGGVSAGQMGPSHHALEDLGMMRSLPDMTVVVPPDATSVPGLVAQLAAVPGPVYLRLGRKAVPDLPDGFPVPRVGRLDVVHDAAEPDAVVVATGAPALHAALDAVDRLRAEGRSVTLLHAHTLKPFDTATLVAHAERAPLVVTVEEHWRACGLGSLVAEELSEHAPRRVVRIGLPDDFVRTVGTPEELLTRAGVTADAVVAAVTGAAVRGRNLAGGGR